MTASQDIEAGVGSGPKQAFPLLRATNVTKTFAGTVALKGVDLELKHGQIVSIVGENGAGKSTLKNILCGISVPDEGELELEGRKIRHFHAADLGIAAVHQEFSLFKDLSVMENICIVGLPGSGGIVNWREARKLSRKYLEMVGADLKPDTAVERLSTGEQQLVEIAKALRYASKILILDEPTTSLTSPERKRLFEVVKRLVARGLGIIFITHFIDEVYEIADRIVVLRDGQFVGGGSVTEIPRRQLEELMVGRSIVDRKVDIGCPSAEAALEVRSLGAPPRVHDVSFTLHRGEILGVSGLMGAGRTELVESIFGLRACSGEVLVNGRPARRTSPVGMKMLEVAFVPEDRHTHGLFEVRSLKENISAAAVRKFVKRVLYGVGFRGEQKKTSEVAEQLRVVHPGIERPVSSLSGGNQQKSLIGRWLAIEPEILILDDPTRGVDIGAKNEIHETIAELSRSGKSVLLVSSDLAELMLLCHRIIVLRKGRVTAELGRDKFDPVEIIKYAAREMAGIGADGNAS